MNIKSYTLGSAQKRASAVAEMEPAAIRKDALDPTVMSAKQSETSEVPSPNSVKVSELIKSPFSNLGIVSSSKSSIGLG